MIFYVRTYDFVVCLELQVPGYNDLSTTVVKYSSGLLMPSGSCSTTKLVQRIVGYCLQLASGDGNYVLLMKFKGSWTFELAQCSRALTFICVGCSISEVVIKCNV